MTTLSTVPTADRADNRPLGRGDAPRGTSIDEDAARADLYQSIAKKLGGSGLHSEEVQYELACWVHLFETTETGLKDGAPKDKVKQRLVREAQAAIPALLSANPELVFARALRMQADIELLRHNGLIKRTLIRLTDGSPVLTVCLGAVVSMMIGLAMAAVSVQDFAGVRTLLAAFNLSGAPTLTVVAFAGGVASILSRLRSFSRLGDYDHVLLFLNALLKPFLGMIFALFAFAVWQSGLLPLDPTVLKDITVEKIWTVGFLAGFSERFAKDLISRGESMFGKAKTS